MNGFQQQWIQTATETDVPDIVALLNMAYRGEPSRKGWTTEANLIAGDIRTNAEDVLTVMREDESVFLRYSSETGELIGCVNLKKQGNRIYLGMFSVHPDLQGAGIGGQLLAAAEGHALRLCCTSIYMYVISARNELIDWYKRKGFRDTGERVPFQENFTGRHLQPLEFAVLEKQL